MLHLAVLHGQAGCGATGRLPPHQPERGNAARSRPQCAAAKSGCRPARPIALGHRRPPIQSRDRQRGPARRCPSMRPSSPLALHETPAPQCPPHEGCTGWGALTGQKKKPISPGVARRAAALGCLLPPALHGSPACQGLLDIIGFHRLG